MRRAQRSGASPKGIKKLEKAIIFSLYLYAIFAPHSIFLSEVAVIFGLVLAGVKIIATRKLEGRWLWIKGSLQSPILGFFAIGIFSLFTAYDRSQALGQIKSLWLFLFYFLIVNSVNEKRDIVRLIILLVISTTVAAIYGLFQYFFMHTIAVQAFIKNVITLAGIFLLVIPLSFSLFLVKKWRKMSYFFVLTSLFLLLGLVLHATQSLGSASPL